MALTYTTIASTTLVSGAADITFSNIPATYTDLILFISARTNRSGAVGDNLLISYNGSTSSQLDVRLFGDGVNVNAFTDSALYSGIAAANSSTGGVFGNTMIYIPNYRSSNNKSSISNGMAENNGITTAINLGSELWSNSAVITSIAISSRFSATFQPHSSATLCGIKNTV